MTFDLYIIILKVLTMVFTDKVNHTMVTMTITGTDSTSNKTQVSQVVWLH